MPIYEYQATDVTHGCASCGPGFDVIQQLSEAALTVCPTCGASVHKLISAPQVGGSKSNFDDRAKSAGFSKLKKTGKGEYEKLY